MFIVNDLKNTTTNFVKNKKPEKVIILYSYYKIKLLKSYYNFIKIDLFRMFRPQNLSSTIWHKLNSKSFPETLNAVNID